MARSIGSLTTCDPFRWPRSFRNSSVDDSNLRGRQLPSSLRVIDSGQRRGSNRSAELPIRRAAEGRRRGAMLARHRDTRIKPMKTAIVTGGSIINITSAMVDHPIAGINSAVPMITKGGLEAVTRSLAMEYVKQGIRVNAVAPGVVDTPMHDEHPMDFLKTLQPMGGISDVKDIVDAIIYLTEAGQVTGEVLHVDGGAHVGKW